MAARRPLVVINGVVQQMPDGDYVPVTNGGTGGDSAEAARTFLEVRRQLSSARTYYVRTDGSNLNDGLSNTSGGAFLTIQKAADVVAGLDLNSYPVTIRVADGTYANPTIFRSVFGGMVTVTGNAAAPDNVLVSLSGGTCFTVDNCGVTVANMKLQTSGVAGFTSSTAGRIIGTNITFGACGYAHVAAMTGGRVILSGNIRIVGGAPSFSNLDEGNLDVSSVSFTLTGTPAFSFFIYAINASYARVVQPTFSGSATGVRYFASLNSVINVLGAGATFLPGNAAGSTATGGQYA